MRDRQNEINLRNIQKKLSTESVRKITTLKKKLKKFITKQELNKILSNQIESINACFESTNESNQQLIEKLKNKIKENEKTIQSIAHIHETKNNEINVNSKITLDTYFLYTFN